MGLLQNNGIYNIPIDFAYVKAGLVRVPPLLGQKYVSVDSFT